MDFQQAQYPLEILIKRIRTGRLALPDFQREFVWSPGNVAELLDSVARQWPIGSLLLLTGPQPFAFRPVDAGPIIDDQELDLYILDGQQRVTALYHAMADVSEYCYFVDLAEASYSDEAPIRWERRQKFEIQYPDAKSRAGARVALIWEVSQTERFYDWLQHVPTESERADLLRVRERKLIGLQVNVYKIMAIVLDQSIELEALARIFETLNRTGVALNAFDLMVAAMYPTGFALREEWDRAKDDYPLIRAFDPKELDVLRLIALLVRIDNGSGESRGVRQGDILALNRDHIKQYWPKACELFNEALEFCAGRFGTTCPEVIPAWTMVLTVACALHLRLPSHQIENWWMRALLDQTHAQAANTRVVADVDGMRSGKPWGVEELPEELISFGPKRAKANGLLTRGLAALLIKNGARDILSSRLLRECSGVAFRSIDSPNQVLRRLNSDDRLSSLFLVSSESDKKLKRLVSFGAPNISLDALASQGLDSAFSNRRDHFFRDLVTDMGETL